jgi:hypothetical protein
MYINRSRNFEKKQFNIKTIIKAPERSKLFLVKGKLKESQKIYRNDNKESWKKIKKK